MTTFSRYLQTAHSALNREEVLLEDLWAARLRAMEEREEKLRNALIAVLLLWPFDARGRLRRRDLALRGEIRRLRQRAERLVDDFERDLVREFSGSERGWRSIQRRDSRQYFVETRHLHIWEAAVRGQRTAATMELALIAAEGRDNRGPGSEPPRPPREPEGPGSDEPEGFVDFNPPKDDPRFPSASDFDRKDDEGPIELSEEEERRADQAAKIRGEFDALYDDIDDAAEQAGIELPGKMLRRAKKLLDKAEELRRVLDLDPKLTAYLDELIGVLKKVVDAGLSEDIDDLVDLLEAALDNPEGNIQNRSRQVREKLRDLSYDSTATRSQIIQEINGSPRPNATRIASSIPAGVKLNRAHMQLSVQAHARAAFRQQLQAFADRRGLKHAILEYPVSRRESIRPGGAIAQHANQLRSTDEWREIYRQAASARFSTGTSLLGLHPGDFSYLVPVPERWLGDAQAYSKRTRGRLLAYLERRRRAA